MRKYKLSGKVAVVCHDLFEWGTWYETADRKVARDDIEGIIVSTVFLGIDHGFSADPDSDPLLFESLVFLPDDETGEMRRYFTWEEAEEGHSQIVDAIKEQLTQSGSIGKAALQKILDRHE